MNGTWFNFSIKPGTYLSQSYYITLNFFVKRTRQTLSQAYATLQLTPSMACNARRNVLAG